MKKLWLLKRYTYWQRRHRKEPTYDLQLNGVSGSVSNNERIRPRNRWSWSFCTKSFYVSSNRRFLTHLTAQKDCERVLRKLSLLT